MVTGSVNHRNRHVLKNVYDQMPSPKVVVAMGVCPATGGIFADCYNVIGGAGKVIPVDVFVPGCPPKPEAMIDGIIEGVRILERKRQDSETEQPELPVKVVRPAPAPAVPAAPAAAIAPATPAVPAAVPAAAVPTTPVPTAETTGEAVEK
ncbi:NAD(P)H-quinone oxidoreductase subunit K, chloroplastic [bioreactor metagenome]|uniref:NAD(P)H-quinone oxidoreductase subunit K, chloroplastic n=1 Tax=bioreactor metagenome TaxID=1076179 RepID=A0A645ENP8_9ZZZZ